MFELSNSNIVDDSFKNFTPEDIEAAIEKMRAAFPAIEAKRFGGFWDPITPTFLTGCDKPLVDTGILCRARFNFMPILPDRRILLTVGLDEIFREIDELCEQLGISPEEFEDIDLGDRSDDTDLECFASVDTVLDD